MSGRRDLPPRHPPHGDDDTVPYPGQPYRSETTGVHDCDREPIAVHALARFEERLKAELNRAGRFHRSISLVMIQVLELVEGDRCLPVSDQGPFLESLLEQVEQPIRHGLRAYDILGRTESSLLMILPDTDADACAAVVARLRQHLESIDDGDSRVCICVGASSCPDEGTDRETLMACARTAIARDRQRLLDGTVEIDKVPVSMVERLPDREEETAIWFSEFPRRMMVQVLQTLEGVRLKMPLSFLRRGRVFRLDAKHGPYAGVVKEALVSRYRSADDAPVVYLDVTTHR